MTKPNDGLILCAIVPGGNMAGIASVSLGADVLTEDNCRLLSVSSDVRRRVLVVENDPGQREFIKKVLDDTFSVTTSTCAKEALALIENFTYDAVLSDMDLDDLTGLQLMTAVRDHDMDLPFVLMTALPTVENAAGAIELGAIRYLTKPLNPDEVRAAVASAIQICQLARVKREVVLTAGDVVRRSVEAAGLKAVLTRVIDDLWVTCQPIVSWSEKRIWGFEALLRSDEPTLGDPSKILAAAEQLDLTHELGRAVRRRVASIVPRLPADTVMLANLHPRDFEDEDLYTPDAPLSLVADRVILEITERATLDRIVDFHPRILALRQLGYRLAIDDLGSGYSGLTSLVTVKPDIIKIDMNLVRGVDRDPNRTHLIKAILRVCSELNVQVVTEGVERQAECDVLTEAGCDLLQGYLFARPAKGLPEVVFQERGATDLGYACRAEHYAPGKEPTERQSPQPHNDGVARPEPEDLVAPTDGEARPNYGTSPTTPGVPPSTNGLTSPIGADVDSAEAIPIAAPIAPPLSIQLARLKRTRARATDIMLSPRKVLVVDDDPSIRELLWSVLVREGYTVVLAASLAEARAEIAKNEFELALLDNHLPDGRGLELSCELNSRDHRCALVVVSADATFPTAVQAMQVEVNDYISKPLIDIGDFIARIKRALELQSLQQSNQEMLVTLRDENEFLESLVVRDPLTGAYNHAYFQQRLEEEVSRAARNQIPLSLLMLDLDSFKEVNDRLGHQAGDDILCEFAATLCANRRQHERPAALRLEDVVARYGGDEFALILPHTNKEEAMAVAERIRSAVYQQWMHADTGRGLSVSIGCATMPTDAQDRVAIIRAADCALTCAKNGGRNRSVSYTAGQGIQQAGLRHSRLPHLPHPAPTTTERGCADSFHFDYQPVIQLSSGRMVGYQALRQLAETPTSSARTPRVTPPAGRTHIADWALRQASIESLAKIPEDELLFVNLRPNELENPEWASPDGPMAQAALRIVFELNDILNYYSVERLEPLLHQLRQYGYRIALEDLDGGSHAIQALACLQPNYIKLGGTSADDVCTNRRIARLTEHLCRFAIDEGIEVIATGIETDAHSDAMKMLGCTLAQGGLVNATHPIPWTNGQPT